MTDEWRCADCGALHTTGDPPCKRCGHGSLIPADEYDTGENRVDAPTPVHWRCAACGRTHQKNAPPCGQCGGMQFEPVYGDTPSDADDPDVNANPTPGEMPSFTSSAGDVLFNKSLTRQLIDLELLLLTGLTWGFFLLTEVIYHRWRQGKGQTTQYSHAGGVGEGWITKLAKVLFWVQIGLVVLGLAVLLS